MADRPRFVEDILADVETRWGERAAVAASEVIEWAERQRLKPTVTPENPTKGVAFQPAVRGIEGWEPWPIDLYPKLGTVVVEIGWLQKHKPFDSEALREQLRSKLADAIPEVDWSVARKSHFPDVSLEMLAEGENLMRFLSVIDWIVERIRRFYRVE